MAASDRGRDPRRRRLLTALGAMVAAAALGAGALLLRLLAPALPVDALSFEPFDVAGLREGEAEYVDGGDGPAIIVLRRSPEQIARLREAAEREPARGVAPGGDPPGLDPLFRSVSEQVFVGYVAPSDRSRCAVRYLGPEGRREWGAAPLLPWGGGFFSPCPEAWFDPSGRALAAEGHATPPDLPIPPYSFDSAFHLRIGPLPRRDFSRR